ncbi:MAG: SagB/ThcOx family dehydrogenase, partial [Planctomycetes bacterium]|nr:SagB/ThcOx family dehydrogenase [Planctomycetota bacterium]
NYQAMSHSLVLHWEGDFWADLDKMCYGHEVIAQSDILLILSGVWNRSTWRYKERGYRRILLDTGHIVGNISMYASEEGFATFTIGGIYDAAINNLLFFPEKDEGVLLLTSLPRKNNKPKRKVRQSAVYPADTGTQSAATAEQESTMLELHNAAGMGAGEHKTDTILPNLEILHDLNGNKKQIDLSAGLLPWKETPQEIDGADGRPQSHHHEHHAHFGREALDHLDEFSHGPCPSSRVANLRTFPRGLLRGSRGVVYRRHFLIVLRPRILHRLGRLG